MTTTSDTVLIVRHLPQMEQSHFEVTRLADGRSSLKPLKVPIPGGFPVQGRPKSDLMRELRWYLETFLEYPFPPETDHAERVQEALKDWGEQAFNALFGSLESGALLHAATSGDYARLRLRIISDDPAVLAWPWEALRDPRLGVLAQTCQVERQVNLVLDPPPLPSDLPRDRVNILLVTGDRPPVQSGC